MTFAAFAQELVSARRDARRVNAELVPTVGSVSDAYRIQSELADMWAGDVRGWKVTALTAADQAKFSSSRPVAGALFGGHVHHAPFTLVLSNFVTPLLECEIAFVLGKDLPERAKPYLRHEVADAIAHVVTAFEIPDSRVAPEAPDLLKLADCMSNGAFVTGVSTDLADVSSIDVVLRHDGVIVQRGNSARILGDPLLAVVALANAQPLPAAGLRKGQIVTTGTCTDPIDLRKGNYAAEFGPLGVLNLTIV
jgi:2-keto-4-pentenoate hydratase